MNTISLFSRSFTVSLSSLSPRTGVSRLRLSISRPLVSGVVGLTDGGVFSERMTVLGDLGVVGDCVEAPADWVSMLGEVVVSSGWFTGSALFGGGNFGESGRRDVDFLAVTLLLSLAAAKRFIASAFLASALAVNFLSLLVLTEDSRSAFSIRTICVWGRLASASLDTRL